MSFAYDWASKYDTMLAQKIESKAREYYMNDCDCPLTWEPGGFDFLSPCLQEASIMLKILDQKEFEKWLKFFLPKFEKAPEKFMEVAVVTDRSDGKLAHLDGLNFSRAWCLYEMGQTLDNQAMIDFGNWRSLTRERYLIGENRPVDETLLQVVQRENLEGTNEDARVESSDVSCDQFSAASGPGL